ncbi:uncharacterized protein PG998_008417 [Apiospora kogelbergensis]|uniref:uncharacterized protein n=1 Tax=Apiospora kogelbergensis TaxID=1337665 RepID=UPI00313183E8
MAASSGYSPEFPSSFPATDKLRQFIPSFFQLSDDPSKDAEWVEHFCPDATVVMGDDEACGTDGIRQLRGRMWNKVTSRKHTLYRFSEGARNDADEKGERDFTLSGQVEYELKTAEAKLAQWTAHAKVREDVDRVRFIYYKVQIHN